jgi:hypothetical protein
MGGGCEIFMRGKKALRASRRRWGICLAASPSRDYPYKQQERTYSPAQMIGQTLSFAFHWPVNAGLPEAPANPLLDAPEVANDAEAEAEAEVTNANIN